MSEAADKAMQSVISWASGVEFESEQHRAALSLAVVCLLSDEPFCLLDLPSEARLAYYKEAIVKHLKSAEVIPLLYFDPKFGDDLTQIVNKELEAMALSDLDASRPAVKRKILIVDNEESASDIDWELIDSLRHELKTANIGVLVSLPLDAQQREKVMAKCEKFHRCEFAQSNQGAASVADDQSKVEVEKVGRFSGLFKRREKSSTPK